MGLALKPRTDARLDQSDGAVDKHGQSMAEGGAEDFE